MSQQQFEPQQNERPFNTSENQARPYYWSTRPNTGNMPKNEHPSTFEDSIPPYSYPAQGGASQKQQERATYTTASQQSRQRQQRQRFSPDGEAMESGYRPYATYNMQVPPWARPQRNNMPLGRILFFTVLAILLAKPLLFILGGLIVVAGVLFAIGLVILSVIAVLLLLVLAGLGIGPRRIFRSRNRWRQWRGYV